VHAALMHMPIALLASAVVLGRRRLAAGCAVAALSLGAVAFYGLIVEPRRIEVTFTQVRNDKVAEPLRIALVSDLQTDDVGKYERRALRAVLAANPDLILFSGDYIQVPGRERDRQKARLRTLLQELQFAGELGAIAVRGDTDFESFPEIFFGLPVEADPRTRRYHLGEVTVTALSREDSWNESLEVPAADGFHVVLGHRPDFALGSIDADLLLAGHTHGGQVQIPGYGPIVTYSKVPRSWAAGSTKLEGGRTLYVSRGIGMERGHAPRIRLWCRPEVAIIDVLPDRAPRSES